MKKRTTTYKRRKKQSIVKRTQKNNNMKKFYSQDMRILFFIFLNIIIFISILTYNKTNGFNLFSSFGRFFAELFFILFGYIAYIIPGLSILMMLESVLKRKNSNLKWSIYKIFEIKGGTLYFISLVLILSLFPTTTKPISNNLIGFLQLAQDLHPNVFGIIGLSIRNSLFLLIGKTSYIIPAFLILFGTVQLTEKKGKVFNSKGIIMFILVYLIFWGLDPYSNISATTESGNIFMVSFWNFDKYWTDTELLLYKFGPGGLIGSLLALPFGIFANGSNTAIANSFGLYVILIILFIYSFLLMSIYPPVLILMEIFEWMIYFIKISALNIKSGFNKIVKRKEINIPDETKKRTESKNIIKNKLKEHLLKLQNSFSNKQENEPESEVNDTPKKILETKPEIDNVDINEDNITPLINESEKNDEDIKLPEIDFQEVNEIISNRIKNENNEEIQTKTDDEKDIETEKKSCDNEDNVEYLNELSNIDKEIDIIIKTKKNKDDFDYNTDTKVKNNQEYTVPPINLLNIPEKTFDSKKLDPVNSLEARILKNTLQEYGIESQIIAIERGPVLTMFDLLPAPGIKISKIIGLEKDIALKMKTSSVRVCIRPKTGAVGIEVPNKKPHPVMLSEIINSVHYKNSNKNLSLVIGKDITGKIITADLTQMPHLLIAGTTGSGKSVMINSFIISLLMKHTPENLNLILIDPKMVEMASYSDIPHLLNEVVTEPKNATEVLKWAVVEMQNRFKRLAKHGARDITSYRKKRIKALDKDPDRIDYQNMPYLVIIIDELADLMMAASGDIEESICRLAQKARAVGIHLILATQRPSVDVITGLIKSNFPVRISFRVSSTSDSRTILDHKGAETLLGKGDSLYLAAGAHKPIRIQGAFCSDDEIERVITFITDQEYERKDTTFTEKVQEQILNINQVLEEEDPLFKEAVKIVIHEGRASTSFIQRRLRIGYNRAARMIEIMENKNIISSYDDSSKGRNVLVDPTYLETYEEGA